MRAGKKPTQSQTNKTNYASNEAFADIKQAAEEALAFELGRRRDLNVAQIQGHCFGLQKLASPRSVRRIPHKISGYRFAPPQ